MRLDLVEKDVILRGSGKVLDLATAFGLGLDSLTPQKAHAQLPDLTNLRAQLQHLFSSAPPSSASRLRDVMNKDDVLGFAKHVSLQLSCPRRQPQADQPNSLTEGLPV
eukprot:895987-Pelagomonas_calceolata.AAC.1